MLLSRLIWRYYFVIEPLDQFDLCVEQTDWTIEPALLLNCRLKPDQQRANSAVRQEIFPEILSLDILQTAIRIQIGIRRSSRVLKHDI